MYSYFPVSFNPKRNIRGLCGPRKTLTGAAIVMLCDYVLGVRADPRIYFSVSFFACSFRVNNVNLKFNMKLSRKQIKQ